PAPIKLPSPQAHCWSSGCCRAWAKPFRSCAGSLLLVRVFGRPDGPGNQPVVWNPSGVPAFERFSAYVALEAVDLATTSHGFGAAIDRSAFAGPVKRFSQAPPCASDCPITSYIARDR